MMISSSKASMRIETGMPGRTIVTCASFTVVRTCMSSALGNHTIVCRSRTIEPGMTTKGAYVLLRTYSGSFAYTTWPAAVALTVQLAMNFSMFCSRCCSSCKLRRSALTLASAESTAASSSVSSFCLVNVRSVASFPCAASKLFVASSSVTCAASSCRAETMARSKSFLVDSSAVGLKLSPVQRRTAPP